MSQPYRYGVGILLLLVAMGLLWATHRQLLVALARWTDVGARPQPADYVMILNGDEETRPFMAAALVKAGLAHHVLIGETALTPYVRGSDRAAPPRD